MKTKTLSIFLICGVLISVVAYAGALIYLTWPVSEFSIDKSGVFGDSFGVMTSLFSGLAFAGLIITILMQKDELALQREELELTRNEISGQKKELAAQNETFRIQRFENTFFNMLTILESCRADIQYSRQSIPGLSVVDSFSASGKDAVKSIYYCLNGFFYNKSGIGSSRVFKESCLSLDGVDKAYVRFYVTFGVELGQYFRTLYNIIKLIDANFPIEQGRVYSNLLRAQLSRYELLLLLYNCLSSYGDKLAPLVIKYSLLKHIETNQLVEEHASIWPEWLGRKK
ncbi:putative phage abortive infection protein [Pseudomonas sp. 5P_3.1_Bac2]|uniref:putative phage abortive infection protein n=1 Tax=Pseudomonas sp. 5P_3.1_Bac2 TaxID=2971617 RepID=UPI0021C9D62D|nr:putative phage abortive infection protein [Pseudomonas sp. 5P_3.1_Bac2]MCU1717700.1 putative phage abortive infection protein [Pseudomonas sp. 5P_3.1_Bac2]